MYTSSTAKNSTSLATHLFLGSLMSGWILPNLPIVSCMKQNKVESLKNIAVITQNVFEQNFES